jgi:sugar transferase (PEP-CTERM/EpsH1 system associated)
MGYFYSHQLKRQIDSAVANEHFDLIIVVCSSVAPYVADIHGVPKLIDFVDMDSQKWLCYAKFKPLPLAIGYWLEGVKLQRAEVLLASKFNTCTCITPLEMETLHGFGVDVPMGWFPNGVDLDYFSQNDCEYRQDSIAFVGRMDYFPNQQGITWFCKEILPLIQAEHPRVGLTIIGAEPPPAVRALANIPRVFVTGTVPDIRPYAQNAAITVVPLKIARGTQNKILESFAMGVPVVCTSVAAAGVDATPGEHFLVADTAHDFAKAVSLLLGDSVERNRLSDAGRRRAESHYSWQAAMAKLDQLITMCLMSTGRPVKSDTSV